MPTENRSSNTEMVSVPEGFMLVQRSIWTEQQVEAATACITRLRDVPGMRDCDLAMAAIDAAQCKAPDIALSDLLPAPQHPDPIAWMVGTAFWWTREEAERDAAETGLPIVGLGPMAGLAPAEQHQGEPVARVEVGVDRNACLSIVDNDWLRSLKYKATHQVVPLHTHADPAEVERLRSENKRLWAAYSDQQDKRITAQGERDTLRSQLNALEELSRDDEVERLRDQVAKQACVFCNDSGNLIAENEKLRAQLAEAHALLQKRGTLLGLAKRALNGWAEPQPVIDQIDALLSASAEPSAPVAEVKP